MWCLTAAAGPGSMGCLFCLLFCISTSTQGRNLQTRIFCTWDHSVCYIQVFSHQDSRRMFFLLFCISTSAQGRKYQQEYFIDEIVQFDTCSSFPTRIAGEMLFVVLHLYKCSGQKVPRRLVCTWAGSVCNILSCFCQDNREIFCLFCISTSTQGEKVQTRIFGTIDGSVCNIPFFSHQDSREIFCLFCIFTSARGRKYQED